MGRKRTETWGLNLCCPGINCLICKLLGEDREKLRHLRDLFVQGVPAWLLCRAYQLPIRNGRNYFLLRHAFRHGWYRKRSVTWRRHLPIKTITQMVILARLRDSWDLYSKDTPDKMIKLLAELEMVEQKKAAS